MEGVEVDVGVEVAGVGEAQAGGDGAVEEELVAGVAFYGQPHLLVALGLDVLVERGGRVRIMGGSRKVCNGEGVLPSLASQNCSQRCSIREKSLRDR